MKMLRRIHKIENVGVFKDFQNGSRVQFDKHTIIYGRNTYGKTTLSDILQSLATGDDTIITSRASIPSSEKQQSIEFGFSCEASEQKICYKDSKWDSNDINIDIFNNNFVEKNIFTGLSIGRSNKENFTDFILGEEDVNLAKSISIDKKNLGEEKKNLIANKPKFIKNPTDEELQCYIDSVLPVSMNESSLQYAVK